MKEVEMQATLAELKKVASTLPEERITVSEVWKKMHDIADAHYVPAIEFFLSLMQDSDWDWRLEALKDIGFHYEYSPEGEIADRIRQMLLRDPSDAVRTAAAIILRSRSKWPDQALVTALKSDSDRIVRHEAFESLLILAGVPYKTVSEVDKLLREGKQQATWEEVKRILSTEGIKLEIPD